MIGFVLSLFYNTLELKELSSQSPDSEALCVQGISFHTKTHWHVWLNDQQVTFNDAKKFHIVKVAPSKVCFQKKCIKVGACYIPHK